MSVLSQKVVLKGMMCACCKAALLPKWRWPHCAVLVVMGVFRTRWLPSTSRGTWSCPFCDILWHFCVHVWSLLALVQRHECHGVGHQHRGCGSAVRTAPHRVRGGCGLSALPARRAGVMWVGRGGVGVGLHAGTPNRGAQSTVTGTRSSHWCWWRWRWKCWCWWRRRCCARASSISVQDLMLDGSCPLVTPLECC